jgi:hypothetical protein
MTIEQSRFIHGVYGPEDPRDKSSGVIFLFMSKKGKALFVGIPQLV